MKFPHMDLPARNRHSGDSNGPRRDPDMKVLHAIRLLLAVLAFAGNASRAADLVNIEPLYQALDAYRLTDLRRLLASRPGVCGRPIGWPGGLWPQSGTLQESFGLSWIECLT